MEDSMSNPLRYATLAAALLAGTAAAHAQVVIMPDGYTAPAVVAPAPTIITPAPAYVAPAPAYVAPAPAYVAPAPDVIVTEPAPSTEIVTVPAITTSRTVVTRPRETVGQTVVEERVPQPRVNHRRARSTKVTLTPTQRREVLRTIRYERPAAVRETVSYSIGSPLPTTVPIYAMPQQVVYEAPALRGYDYTLIGNRMVVVEPTSRTVVADIY
jgi:hypothetical protein